MAKRPKRPKPSERAETKKTDTPLPQQDQSKKTRKRRTGPRPNKALLAAQLEAKETERLKPNKGGATWQPNARDLEIYAGYVKGEKTQREIAADYHMAVSSINDIIRKVETYLASKNMMQVRELRARVTERLDLLFAWSVQSYLKSLEDEVTITTEPDGKTSERRKGQAGSAAFLSQAREAMSDLLDIWGAKAPKSLALEVNESVRVGGLSAKEAILSRIERLQQIAESNVDSE